MSTAIIYQSQITKIRRGMMSGQLSYEQAKQEAAPIIKRINDTAKVIADRHGVRPKKITFSEIMR